MIDGLSSQAQAAATSSRARIAEMLQLFLLTFLALYCARSLAGQVYSSPIDDYVWTPDENYGWVEMGDQYNIGGVKYGWTVR